MKLGNNFFNLMHSIITTLRSRELNEFGDIVANSRHAAREISKVCPLLLYRGKTFDCSVVVRIQENNRPVFCNY